MKRSLSGYLIVVGCLPLSGEALNVNCQFLCHVSRGQKHKIVRNYETVQHIAQYSTSMHISYCMPHCNLLSRVQHWDPGLSSNHLRIHTFHRNQIYSSLMSLGPIERWQQRCACWTLQHPWHSLYKSLPCLHLHNVLRTDVSSSVITQAGNHGRPPQGPVWWALLLQPVWFQCTGLARCILLGWFYKKNTWSLHHSWALLK